jgi:hypothetical protein
LAARCLQAQDGSVPLPRIALDGPYAAPAQSALSRPILVAVGAGVGITPFLSLMSSLISLIEDSPESEALPLKEAHFFWMTRSVDEFLFGRRHLTRIARSHRLRQKVHLHLHTTAREPEGDAIAYLFRQAVKRQSRVDKAAFRDEFDAHRVLMAPQLPWCWVNKSELDVMWLSDLTTASREVEQQQELAMELAGDADQNLDAAEQGLAGSQAAGSAKKSKWAEDLLRTSSRLCPNERRSTLSLAHRSFARPLSTLTLDDNNTNNDSNNSDTPLHTSEGDSVHDEEEPLVPVAFGRPDFESELRAIGTHWHCQEKVHIYVCGNDAIVKGLRSTAETLNAEARANAGKARAGAQKYVITYERFG